MRSLILIFFVGIVYGAPAAPDSGLCEVCHLLVGEVQDLLTTGKTQNAVTSYVSSACSKLPTEEKDVCNSFLKDHSGTLFHRLIKDLTPHEFCKRLTDVCPVYYGEPEPVEEEDVPTANPLECELCKLAVLGIDRLIKENRSSAAINSTLEKFCEGLPDKLKDVCLRIEPAILNGLSTGFDPKIVCKFAALCTVEGSDDFSQISCDVCYTVMDAMGISDTESICASQKSCVRESEAQRKEEETKPEVQDTLECQICKLAVEAIDTLVGENKSVAAINSTLYNLCNSLPGELKDSCLNVEPDILKAVLGGIDPSKACDFLKICNDDNEVPLSSLFISCDVCKEALEAVAGEKGVQQCYKFKDVCGLEYPQEEEKVDTPTCELCQFLVKSVSGLVQADKSRDAVAKLLDYICTPLPEQAKLFCKNHRDSIIDQVTSGVSNPKQSCQQIDVCKEYEKDLFSFEAEKENVKYSNLTDDDDAEQIQFQVRYLIQADARCELCKFVVQLLDESMQKNDSITKINATLFEICNALPANYKPLCIGIIPLIEAAVAAGLDPTNSCIASSFCTSTTDLVSIEDLKCELCARFVESLPDQKAFKVKNGVCNGACRTRSRRSVDMESSLQYKVKEIMQATNLKGATECELCHLFIGTLDKLVGENASIETVNKTVYEICTRLTGIQLQQICLQEAPTLIILLKNGIDADKTCIAAKLCPQVKIKKRSVRHIGEVEEDKHDLDSALMKMLVTKQRKHHNVGDLACDVCEEVVKFVDQLLEENATIEKINETLYQLCSGLSAGALKDLCLQEIPVIVNTTENGFDPEKTCTLAGLCTGNGRGRKMKSRKVFKRVHETLEERQHEASENVGNLDSALMKALVTKQREQHNVGDLACDVCEEVVKLLDGLVENNATDDKINQTLYKLCSGLPSGALKDLCIQEIPAIMNTTEQGFDPEKACTLAGLCTGNAKSADRNNILTEEEDEQHETSETVGNLKDLKCDVCEVIIDGLDSVIEQNATIEKINETVYNLCADLPGALQDLCLQAAPQIVQVLQNGVNPAQACTAIGLCSGLSEMDVSDQQEKEDLNNNVEDAKCDICELIIQGLDEVIGKNSSALKINETMYKICDDLTGSAKSFCVLLAPAIVIKVESGADPKTVCVVLKQCTSNGPQDVEKNVGDIKCDICELIIRELDNIVGQNASAEKINATIYNICSQVPGTAGQFCLLVAPKLVKALESGADPEKVCSDLNLCTSLEQHKFERNVGDIKCDICELIIRELDNIVGQNASAEKINATIYNLCSQIPGTAGHYCLLIAPTIVKALESGVDPEQGCEVVKLCTSLDETSEDTVLEVRKDPLDCSICIRSLEAAYEDVSGNYAKVQRHVLRLCSSLPVIYRDTCEYLIQNDHGRLYKMVLASYTPTALCEMAKCHENEGPIYNNSS